MKLFFFLPLLCGVLSAAAQPPEIYRAPTTSDLCPSTLTLHSNGEYAFAHGCETTPLLSFGTWTKKKDTVKFTPANPASFTVIKNIESSRIPGDSVWLTILDKNGVNMTAAVSAGLEVSGRGSYMMSNDGNGRKFVYKREGGMLVLRTLGKLFRRRIEFATDTANQFLITLNLDATWITSTHADWDGGGPFSLLRKGDALYPTSTKTQQAKSWIRQADQP